MKTFLGPFDFLWDLPSGLIPDRMTILQKSASFAWRTALVVAVGYVAITQIYYEYFLWTVER
jgi:hypothetical protein